MFTSAHALFTKYLIAAVNTNHNNKERAGEGVRGVRSIPWRLQRLSCQMHKFTPSDARWFPCISDQVFRHHYNKLGNTCHGYGNFRNASLVQLRVTAKRSFGLEKKTRLMVPITMHINKIRVIYLSLQRVSSNTQLIYRDAYT